MPSPKAEAIYSVETRADTARNVARYLRERIGRRARVIEQDIRVADLRIGVYVVVDYGPRPKVSE